MKVIQKSLKLLKEIYLNLWKYKQQEYLRNLL